MQYRSISRNVVQNDPPKTESIKHKANHENSTNGDRNKSALQRRCKKCHLNRVWLLGNVLGRVLGGACLGRSVAASARRRITAPPRETDDTTGETPLGALLEPLLDPPTHPRRDPPATHPRSTRDPSAPQAARDPPAPRPARAATHPRRDPNAGTTTTITITTIIILILFVLICARHTTCISRTLDTRPLRLRSYPFEGISFLPATCS